MSCKCSCFRNGVFQLTATYVIAEHGGHGLSHRQRISNPNGRAFGDGATGVSCIPSGLR